MKAVGKTGQGELQPKLYYSMPKDDPQFILKAGKIQAKERWDRRCGFVWSKEETVKPLKKYFRTEFFDNL